MKFHNNKNLIFIILIVIFLLPVATFALHWVTSPLNRFLDLEISAGNWFSFLGVIASITVSFIILTINKDSKAKEELSRAAHKKFRRIRNAIQDIQFNLSVEQLADDFTLIINIIAAESNSPHRNLHIMRLVGEQRRTLRKMREIITFDTPIIYAKRLCNECKSGYEDYFKSLDDFRQSYENSAIFFQKIHQKIMRTLKWDSTSQYNELSGIVDVIESKFELDSNLTLSKNNFLDSYYTFMEDAVNDGKEFRFDCCNKCNKSSDIFY